MQAQDRQEQPDGGKAAPIRQEADSKLRILEEGGSSSKTLVQQKTVGQAVEAAP